MEKDQKRKKGKKGKMIKKNSYLSRYFFLLYKEPEKKEREKKEKRKKGKKRKDKCPLILFRQ